MSEGINELAAALAKAQGAIRGAAKDTANTFFKSKYADLASVWEACRGPLTENGLSVVQLPSAEGAKVTVTTMLAHASGQSITGHLTASAKDDSPQAVGSAITYLRRYGLQSMVGVAPEDDDGEAAQGRGQHQQERKANGNGGHHEPPAPPKRPVDPMTKDQREQLIDVATSAGLVKGQDVTGLRSVLTKALGRPVASTQDIGASEFKAAMGAVEAAAMASKEADVEEIFGPGARG